MMVITTLCVSCFVFFFSSRRRHTRLQGDWSSDVCSSDLPTPARIPGEGPMPPCVGPFSFLGAIGPMARTIDDVELLFRALAGQDPVDPVSPPIALRTPSLDEVKRLAIGYFEDD